MIVLRLVGNLLLFLAPAALVGLRAWRLSRTSRDEWQLLAWIPIMPLLLWGSWMAWSVTRDPTSHNLWPFELVLWTLFSGVLFGAFLIGRRLAGQPRRDWNARDRSSAPPDDEL